MPRATFLVAGPENARTGGSIYNQRLAQALRGRGWSVDVRELPADFPEPSAASLRHASQIFDAIPDGATTVVDGLAFGAMPDVVTLHRDRLLLVPIVHMPLADEADLDERRKNTRQLSEQRSLAAAACVVVTGRAVVETIAALGVARNRIAVVMPGTDRADIARGTGQSSPHLVCVAALMPGKGHDVLLHALADNRRYPWRLTCAGSVARAPQTTQAVRTLTETLALGDRVIFTGELDTAALNEVYADANLFVLASTRETFGMAAAEALARAIPVIGTAVGELPFLVGEDAGVLVRPGDHDALSAALTRVLTDAGLRSKLHAGALAARDRLPGWDAAACTMIDVLERTVRLSGVSRESGAR